jgi:predicted GNAT family acetyltransferase
LGCEAIVPREAGGPAFTFPDTLSQATDVVVVDDERLLQHNFHGWVPGEIAGGRAPVLALVQNGYPVSVCFCARLSDEAAEAGLETAQPFRGRGLALRVTAAWASAIRAMGRIPLYSTYWTNDASRAVARKLGLAMYAGNWSLSD